MQRKQLIQVSVAALIFVIVSVGLITWGSLKYVEKRRATVLKKPAEEVEEVIEGEPIPEDIYEDIRRAVQERLLVYDVDKYHDQISREILQKLRRSDDEEEAKGKIRAIVEAHLDEWKRADILSALQVLGVEHTEQDVERLMEDTTNAAIVDLVVAFEWQWYKKNRDGE